jgi:hypothetical protein
MVQPKEQTNDGATLPPPHAMCFSQEAEIRGPRAASPRHLLCSHACVKVKWINEETFTHPTFKIHLDTEENEFVVLQHVPPSLYIHLEFDRNSCHLNLCWVPAHRPGNFKYINPTVDLGISVLSKGCKVIHQLLPRGNLWSTKAAART